MSTPMTGIDPTLLEQLCAWMDGELPADEARFLQKRLERDPALRAQWERWQLASACLRGQRVRAMPATLAPAIARAVEGQGRRRGHWPWMTAAAAAVLVAVLLPGAPVQEPGPARLAVPSTSTSTSTPAATSPLPPRPPVVDAPALEDVLPSISEFPLAERERQAWPRSPLATDQQQLEAYLVGHNTLMAQDGLGGFMPYVDVVAHDGAPDAAADMHAEGAGPVDETAITADAGR